LQFLAKKYMQGEDDVMVLSLLQELCASEEYGHLEHLVEIKKLLELGWLHQQSFTPMKISELTPLELLNTAVGLTPAFLRLLQEGTLESDLPEIKPYADHLEYLQDQFLRIELYQKMSTIRQSVHEHSLGIDRVQNKLKHLENRIEERVAQTSKNLVLDKFFKQKKMNDYEQVIFIALLREEYSSSDASLREMNALIDLISLDEYERIKNRSLLEEGSHLLSSSIIDYEEMLNPFGGISRAFYIVDDVLQSIMHPNKALKEIEFMLNNNGEETITGLREELQQSMTANAGAFRTKETLEIAIAKVKELRQRFKNIRIKDKSKLFNTELQEAIEFGHMLDYSAFIVESAIAREESRGAHYREDFEARDDEKFLKHTMAYMNDNGEITLDYMKVILGKHELKARTY